MNRYEKLDFEKSVSKAAVRELQDETLINSRNFIKHLMDFRKSKKLFNTYITRVKKAMEYNGSDKIYVEYRLDGTVTGRLSNAGYDAGDGGKMGISFHTLPRDTKFNIREYVVAPTGYKFITADMKSMELRILAHLAREKNMEKAFNDRIDLHM